MTRGERLVAALIIAWLMLMSFGLDHATAATTIIEPPNSWRPYQQWVNEAKIPTPNITVEVVQSNAGCGAPLPLACATEADQILLWEDGHVDRRQFFHELGHLTALLRPELAPYFNEAFADTFSLCARERGNINPRWGYSIGSHIKSGADVGLECATIAATLEGDATP